MTLATNIPTNLDGAEIPPVSKSAKDLDTLQRAMAKQYPVLARMLALLKQIQDDPYSIFSGSGSDYEVEILASSLFLGSTGASTAGVAPYAGDFYVGIVMDTNGLTLGYNRKDTGAWVDILELIPAGSVMAVEFNGTHASGSINGAVTVVGYPMSSIKAGGERAMNAINASNVVVGDVSSSSVYGTAISGVNLSLSGSITGIGGSISCFGNINSVTSVSSSTQVTAPVIVASAGFSLSAGYIQRPFNATGRLTVNDQTSPYASVGTFTYSFHL